MCIRDRHDIKISSVNRFVLTQPDHFRYWDSAVAELVHQSILACHVVSRWQQWRHWWSAQHKSRLVTIAHRKGHIGSSARNQLILERPIQRRVLANPCGNTFDVYDIWRHLDHIRYLAEFDNSVPTSHPERSVRDALLSPASLLDGPPIADSLDGCVAPLLGQGTRQTSYLWLFSLI